MSVLSKVAREVLDLVGGAISKASVVTIVLLVGTSHLLLPVSKPALNLTWIMTLCTGILLVLRLTTNKGEAGKGLWRAH